jgi:hypothetical protein
MLNAECPMLNWSLGIPDRSLAALFQLHSRVDCHRSVLEGQERVDVHFSNARMALRQLREAEDRLGDGRHVTRWLSADTL